MTDLYWACAVMGAIGLAALVATHLVARRLSSEACDRFALVVVGTLFFYICHLWYDVRIAYWLSTPNLVVFGNWLPILIAPLAALAWRRVDSSRVRQVFFSGALCLCGGYSLVHPLLGEPPQCGDSWDRMGNCLQTTNITCSPACAATLLRSYGIEATEQEMAELCLTRRGTSWQGLYRGLKLKTAGTPWDVEVRSCSTDELRQLADRPMILSVGLESGAANEELESDFGWVPGVNHSVVLLKFNDQGAAVIADPTQELHREHWDSPTLHALWRGYAFRLVERAESAPPSANRQLK